MRLGFGLIGTGFIGKPHALAYRNARAVVGSHLPQVELAMLCDERPGVAAGLADQFGFAKATEDWRELIDSPDVDIVSVATPNRLHPEMAIAALEAGKHVHCEKPLATTLADAKRMASAAETATGRTMVGYNYLFNPIFSHAVALVADGAIGRVTHFRGQFDEDYRADETLPWSWRDTMAGAGLGTLGDLCCHLVSQMVALAGPVESVLAETRTIHPRRRDEAGVEREVENEDVATALVRFASGIHGSVTTSRAAWGRKVSLAWEVHGSEGMIAFDQERLNELQLFQSGGGKSEQGFKTIQAGPEHPPYDKFWPAPGCQLGLLDLKLLEVAHFLEAIRDDRDGSPNFAAALEFEKFIHAVAESAAQQRRVELADM